MKKCACLILLSVSIIVLQGCAGLKSFPNSARAGETVALGLGWQKNFARSNTTVTITPSSGSPITYLPNDPAVRAIINLYPDPVSWMVVGTETTFNDAGQQQQFNNKYQNAYNYGSLIESIFTNNDKDWWQTTAFVDLPSTLSTGTATIVFTNTSGNSKSSTVEIITGAGSTDVFDAEINRSLTPKQLGALERSTNYEVSFTSSTIPHAIEVQMTHSADYANGGTGVVYVANPRGDIKNVTWSDTGTQLKVILLPTDLTVLTNMNDFKFYVTGGITGLNYQNIKAFDINGNSLAGVTVSIAQNN